MWATIRAALKSWAWTARLCVILVAVNTPMVIVALLR